MAAPSETMPTMVNQLLDIAQHEVKASDAKASGALSEATSSAVAAETDDLAITIIERRSGWRFIDLKELWRYRELLWFLALRDVKRDAGDGFRCVPGPWEY